ncbi:MAG: hypothetical protein R2712_13200 [Vicinamibacterales bacterium]
MRVELLEPSRRIATPLTADLPDLDPGLPFDRKGRTLLDAVMLGVGDALRADPRVFVYGEDVGGHAWQRLPAAASAARGVRRSHHQLAPRRERGPRRL